MEYNKENLIKDFFKRTKQNLDLYMKNRDATPEIYNQEVTMIINSLLGMLVFVQQNSKSNKLLNKIKITSVIDKAIYINQEHKTIHNFFRHMRNSIAHGHCLKDFKIDEKHQIKSLTFRDFHNGHQTFEIELDISEMKKIINAINDIFNC